MLTKSEAIVLHSLKYGEGRIITDMYTREHGRLSFIVPAPRSERSKIKKLTIGLFVAEFLYHALRDEQHDAPLFNYVRNSIEWLDGAEKNFANFHLVFLMRLSRFLGFYPNLEEENDYFDLRGATFCATPPLHSDFLMPQEASRIRLLMRMDYPTMHLFRLSRTERNRILELLLLYYRLHLPSFPALRSLSVLQELYQ